jgi:hypothetical protein
MGLNLVYAVARTERKTGTLCTECCNKSAHARQARMAPLGGLKKEPSCFSALRRAHARVGRIAADDLRFSEETPHIPIPESQGGQTTYKVRVGGTTTLLIGASSSRSKFVPRTVPQRELHRFYVRLRYGHRCALPQVAI